MFIKFVTIKRLSPTDLNTVDFKINLVGKDWLTLPRDIFQLKSKEK